MKKKIRIGLIGTGYIGRTHAIAYTQAPTVFPLKGEIVKELVADVSPELAEKKAEEFGFLRSTGNWRDVVEDPNIDVVDICSPNFLHKEMALAAIRNGKHVYSEKPLALNSRDAREMVEEARKAGVKTLVGFNYMKNPTISLAKEMIENGEIGDVKHFYGTFNEDYMADPSSPIHWHCLREKAGLGALADLSAHIINTAQYLVSDITDVCGDMQTVFTTRPVKAGATETAAVENEDQAHAMVRFSNGAIGVVETSRVACGRKNGMNFVITGTKGTLIYNQERMAEIQIYQHTDPSSRQGFKTILTGPEHPDYAYFCLGAGHGIGFNEVKAVEIRDLIDGIAGERPMWPDFEEGWKVSRVIDAIAASVESGSWVNVEDIS